MRELGGGNKWAVGERGANPKWGSTNESLLRLISRLLPIVDHGEGKPVKTRR